MIVRTQILGSHILYLRIKLLSHQDYDALLPIFFEALDKKEMLKPGGNFLEYELDCLYRIKLIHLYY